MTYEALEEGLKSRGFVGIDEICNCGGCHKDEKHYILLTDGLVIYSNIPHWRNCRHLPDGLYDMWPLEKSEYDPTPEFTFGELDKILS